MKHCRFCGKRHKRGARKQLKSKISTIALISASYNTDIKEDNPEVHPPEICLSCMTQMGRLTKAQGTVSFRTDASLFQWVPHTVDSCSMCEHFQTTARGGRPKMLKSRLGWQSGEPASVTLEALEDIAGPALASGINPSRLVPTYFPNAHVVCILCQAIVDAPVQISCDTLVCHPCIHQHIVNNGQICPGCQDTLDTTHFTKCTTLVLDVIAHLHVQCKLECKFPIILTDLLSHESTCGQASHQQLPRWSLAGVTLGEVMNIPLTVPLSADEEAVCSRLVRRSTQDGKLVITTGGQVRTIIQHTSH